MTPVPPRTPGWTQTSRQLPQRELDRRVTWSDCMGKHFTHSGVKTHFLFPIPSSQALREASNARYREMLCLKKCKQWETKLWLDKRDKFKGFIAGVGRVLM